MLVGLKYESLSPYHSQDIANFIQKMHDEPYIIYGFSISYYMGIWIFYQSKKKIIMAILILDRVACVILILNKNCSLSCLVDCM